MPVSVAYKPLEQIAISQPADSSSAVPRQQEVGSPSLQIVKVEEEVIVDILEPKME